MSSKVETHNGNVELAEVRFMARRALLYISAYKNEDLHKNSEDYILIIKFFLYWK